MKISMMTNDQAVEAMVKMAQPIANLMEDEETAQLLESITSADKSKGGVAFVGKILPKVVSFCMKNHKDDVFAVVGALTMKPVDSVGKMNFLETIKELRESIDEDFLGFFKQSESLTTEAGE